MCGFPENILKTVFNTFRNLRAAGLGFGFWSLLICNCRRSTLFRRLLASPYALRRIILTSFWVFSKGKNVLLFLDLSNSRNI